MKVKIRSTGEIRDLDFRLKPESVEVLGGLFVGSVFSPIDLMILGFATKKHCLDASLFQLVLADNSSRPIIFSQNQLLKI